MDLPDVNVLVYAHRAEMDHHANCRRWLEARLNGDQPYGVSNLVLSGFIRVVTHSKIFDPPSPLDAALEFVAQIKQQPHAVNVMPGPRHWDIFIQLLQETQARGNEVPDAYFAALAIEANCKWITFDRGFDKYLDLRWSLPST